MTSIATSTGDDGNTGLFGGDRVAKDNPRVEAYGNVDELNCWIGLVRAGEARPRVRPRPASRSRATSSSSAPSSRRRREGNPNAAKVAAFGDAPLARPRPAIETIEARAHATRRRSSFPAASRAASRAPRRARRLPARRALGRRARSRGARPGRGDPLPEPPLRRALPPGPPAERPRRRARGRVAFVSHGAPRVVRDRSASRSARTSSTPTRTSTTRSTSSGSRRAARRSCARAAATTTGTPRTSASTSSSCAPRSTSGSAHAARPSATSTRASRRIGDRSVTFRQAAVRDDGSAPRRGAAP